MVVDAYLLAAVYAADRELVGLVEQRDGGVVLELSVLDDETMIVVVGVDWKRPRAPVDTGITNEPGEVADAVASTARVITAAAAIMVVAFASFTLEDMRELKIFGLGLAVAVFLDATLVRLVVVPATMELLGDRNWWIPKWFDRILPHPEIEPTQPSVPAGDEQPTPAGLAPVSVDRPRRPIASKA